MASNKLQMDRIINTIHKLTRSIKENRYEINYRFRNQMIKLIVKQTDLASIK